MKLSPLIALGSASIITFDYDQTEYSTDQVVSLRMVFKFIPSHEFDPNFK